MFRKINILIGCFLFLFLLTNPLFSATGYLSRILAVGLLNTDGTVLSDGKVYTYYAGTTTPVSLYTDVNMTTLADNPIELNTDGRALVYGNGSFKFEVTDQYGLTIETFDNVELKSIIDFTTDASDPFGSTLYQTTLIASSITTIDFTTTNETTQNSIVNGSLNSVGDTLISSLSATLGNTLDANNNIIDNLATPTKETNAVNLGYLINNAITSSTIQVFNVPGNATWTCPIGVTKAYISMCGAGGGGGGWGDDGNFAGEAGWNGQAVLNYFITTIPGTNYPIVIGSGGTVGVDGSSGVAGTAGVGGGDTAFDTIIAKGGWGGQGASSSDDCVSGIGIVLSRPYSAPMGQLYSGGISTLNSFNYGQGGIGGHIATYTSGVVRTFPAGKGQNGVVIVEW